VENKTEQSNAPQCDAGCACEAETRKSKRAKFILAAVIIICAGAVLANSIIRKSRQPSPSPTSGYASALSYKADIAAKPDPAGRTEDSAHAMSIATLTSLSSLDEVAGQFDGVFILLVKTDAEKTSAISREIESATTTIKSQGMHMGAFQLAAGTPDFETLNSQLPTPGVLVVVKGRGMRGVSGKNVTRTNLLQACIAAMQPSSCCAAGSNHTCK
jgi:hypothetical protein